MIEAEGEATAVWSHPARIALFLAAMRHFRDELLVVRGFPLTTCLSTTPAPPTLAARLAQALAGRRPAEPSCVCEAGDWRVEHARAGAGCGVRLVLHLDSHFLCPARNSPAGPATSASCAWSSSIARCVAGMAC